MVTFMGGLKQEIVDGIRMFRLSSLKDAIRLAKMKEEQISHQRSFTRTFGHPIGDFSHANKSKDGAPIKKLIWEEIQ